MKFCPACSNFLSKDTSGNILLFKCSTCFYEEKAKDEDSLMLSISIKEEESLYKNEIYLNLAAKDHIAPLVIRGCSNSDCDSELMREVNVMSSGESIYICTKCENRFTNT
jgi:DNA-directed RNA polymerase subunit M/transcription elongation factor TFIIS